MKSFICVILLLTTLNSMAANTCSRTATINGQEFLVDTNYSERGEGLRFYLEKDPEAKKFLDKYQKGTKMKWQNAALGTIGTVLLLAGILSDKDKKDQRTMLLSGAGLMTVNFFVAKTMEAANEKNLIRSIQEYNQRNFPKIYLSPDENQETKEKGISFFLQKNWSF